MATTTAPETRAVAAPRAGGELSAALNGIYTMWYRDVLRYARDRSRIVASLAQPVLFLIVFGLGLSPAIGSLGRGGDLSYVQFIFPGIITMAVLFTAIFSAISVVWDREFGFLREVLVAPVPRWAVAVGKMLGGSTTAMVQGLLILLFAPVIGVPLAPLTVLALLPAVFVTACALSALGLVIAARMRSMEGFQVVMNFLLMPMFFLSGAVFPLGNLPAWLAVLTRVDPVSYGVDAIRQIVLHQAGVPPAVLGPLGIELFGHTTNVLADLGIVAAFAALMIALAVRAFSIQE
ncbi:MAG TPA: ABC transporter permease [Chloroflexota bacterium]|nr:ABC transporter permease [Chloroflexota bacterium]